MTRSFVGVAMKRKTEGNWTARNKMIPFENCSHCSLVEDFCSSIFNMVLDNLRQRARCVTGHVSMRLRLSLS